VQTCGSFLMIGWSSVPPSWILTVPLLPGAPVGAAATGARRANAASKTTDIRITRRTTSPPCGVRVRAMASPLIPTGWHIGQSPRRAKGADQSATFATTWRAQPSKVLTMLWASRSDSNAQELVATSLRCIRAPEVRPGPAGRSCSPDLDFDGLRRIPKPAAMRAGEIIAPG
jgi:hypothetical protein